MVVVDKLTTTSHVVPIKSTLKALNIVDMYMKEVARLHGFSKAIMSDRGSKFTSNVWKGLFKDFGTKLNFSVAYYP